ncbi:hypothetical protein B0H14DRAFT_2639128 [Mycena olivaceomarginata]|nr:hypothetical protein B0H14DRAFT_2639128 [Mycena olivaceomarginata]
MSPSPTFCTIPLSVSVDATAEKSLITLDWVLSNGIPALHSVASGILTLSSGNTVCSMNTELSVCSEHLYDLVLGRDWLFFCQETIPLAMFALTSGIVCLGKSSSTVVNDLLPGASGPSDMDVDGQFDGDTANTQCNAVSAELLPRFYRLSNASDSKALSFAPPLLVR